MVASESGCARSGSLYVFPFGLWFSSGFMDLLWVYGFALGSWFFLWVYVCVFPLGLRLCLSSGFMLFLCSFGFAYTVIQKKCGVLRTKGQGGVVAGKSVSHHHRHSACLRTELRRVYGATGMTQVDCATGADRDTGVTEMDGAMGSIYSGDPGVDRLSSHLISSYHTMNYTLSLSQLCISLVLPRIRRSTQLRGSSWPGSIVSSHPLPTLLEPEQLFLTNSFWNATRGAAKC
jgi:hypothetical protein